MLSFPEAGTALAPAARASLLLAWLLAQPLDGYEKSFKMSEGSLLEKRFLAGLLAADLPSAQLGALCRRLEMPADLLASMVDQYAGADVVHFGYEEGPGSAIFKVYLEYAAGLDAARAAGIESFLLHRAFKWDALDPRRRAVASYRCFPGLSHEQVLARIAALYPERIDHPVLELVRTLTRQTTTHKTAPPMYLEVRETDNSRASFDLNFHAAQLKLTAIESQAFELARRHSIPTSRFQSLWPDVAARTLCHISGGLSRDGQDFLTIYYDPLS